MIWKSIKWSEFCQWIQGKTWAGESEERVEGELATIIAFTDGSSAAVRSQYDGPLSDVTPGDGLMPPDVLIRERQP